MNIKAVIDPYNLINFSMNKKKKITVCRHE